MKIIFIINKLIIFSFIIRQINLPLRCHHYFLLISHCCCPILASTNGGVGIKIDWLFIAVLSQEINNKSNELNYFMFNKNKLKSELNTK